jgi:hypothetical protein
MMARHAHDKAPIFASDPFRSVALLLIGASAGAVAVTSAYLFLGLVTAN